MKQFHGGGAIAYLKKLPIFVFAEKARLFLPDGFLIDIILAWLSVTVS
jgi:hypothetical protein